MRVVRRARKTHKPYDALDRLYLNISNESFDELWFAIFAPGSSAILIITSEFAYLQPIEKTVDLLWLLIVSLFYIDMSSAGIFLVSSQLAPL